MHHIPALREALAAFQQAVKAYLVDHRMTSPWRWLQLAIHSVLAPTLFAFSCVGVGLSFLTGQFMSSWPLFWAMLIIMSLLQLGHWLSTGYGYRSVSATAHGSGTVLLYFALFSACTYWRPTAMKSDEILSASLGLAVMVLMLYVVTGLLFAILSPRQFSGGVLVRYENGPFNLPTTYQSRGNVNGYHSK